MAQELTFTKPELATIVAALNFWSEEIVPYGNSFAIPHLRTTGVEDHEPLNAEEVQQLMNRIQQSLRQS